MREALSANDTMYNPFATARDCPFDHSSLFRLVRRAYAQRYMRAVFGNPHHGRSELSGKQ